MSNKSWSLLGIDEHQFIRQLSQYTHDALFAVDLYGHLILWNQSLSLSTGIPDSEALGRAVSEILPFTTNALARAMDGATTHIENQMWRATADGKAYDVDAIYFPLRNEEERIVGAVGILQDVTRSVPDEHARLLAELANYRQQIRELRSHATAVRELAAYNADALDTERRYKAERQARYLAERAHERTVRLQNVTAALSQATTPGQVTDVIVEQGISSGGSVAGSVVLITPDGTALTVVSQTGYPADMIKTWQEMPLNVQVPLTEAVRRQEAIWLGTWEDMAARYPSAAQHAYLGHRSWAALPLVIDGNAFGALGLSFEEKQTFSHEERDFLQALAHQCAQALHRAQLYQEAVETRGVIQRTVDELKDLYDHAPCGYHSVDETMTVIRMNLTELNWLGYAADEVIGKMQITDLVAQEERENYQEKFAELVEHGYLKNLELSMMRKNGTTLPVLLNSVTITDAQGAFLHSRSTVVDLSERKRLEQHQFELAIERERSKALAAFVRDASHDLRTPLAAMTTSLYLAQRVTDPERQKYHLATLHEKISLLTRLIEDLFTMAELDNTVEPVMIPINLNQLLSEAIEAIRASAEEKRLHLTYIPAPDTAIIQGDPYDLNRAFTRILDNAVRYTGEGGVIDVMIENREQCCIVSVYDTGIGIATEDLPHIFKRFYRADKARTIPGTGLGLPIAKRIVETHQGSIEVETEPQKGSTFRVSLPRR